MLLRVIRMNHLVLDRDIVPPEEFDHLPARVHEVGQVVDGAGDGDFGRLEGAGCDYFGTVVGADVGGFDAVAEGVVVAAHG